MTFPLYSVLTRKRGLCIPKVWFHFSHIIETCSQNKFHNSVEQDFLRFLSVKMKVTEKDLNQEEAGSPNSGEQSAPGRPLLCVHGTPGGYDNSEEDHHVGPSRVQAVSTAAWSLREDLHDSEKGKQRHKFSNNDGKVLSETKAGQQQPWKHRTETRPLPNCSRPVVLNQG